MSRWTYQVLSEKGRLVYLTTSFPDGRQAYYYLLLTNPARTALFESLDSQSILNLESFGTIVRSGWGEPTEIDRQYFRDHFHADL